MGLDIQSCSLRGMAVLVGRAKYMYLIKAGEGRETARRLGRECANFAASPLVRPARQNRHATHANSHGFQDLEVCSYM